MGNKNHAFTYVLYDSKYDLYKIGKSGSILYRWNQLCSDTIQPVYLLDRDIESKMHKRYAAQRVTHPEKFREAKTEYFKVGGVFRKTAEKLKTLSPLPYINPHRIGKELDVDISYEAELALHLEFDKLFNFKIGFGILAAFNIIPNSNKITKKGRFYGDVFLFDGKVAISPKLFEELKKYKYKIRVKHEIAGKKGFIRSNMCDDFYITRIIKK